MQIVERREEAGGRIMRQRRGYIRVLAPFCILVIFLLLTLTASYKPVIVVHGLFDSPSDFGILLDYINEVGNLAWMWEAVQRAVVD
ncbi:UNVERIFIED_CONTAM: hypothetical protein K2H54_061022 [Gekko kuhli]